MYAKVLIEYKVKSLDKVWTYKIPQSLNVLVGNKVLVPFGNNKLNGLVLEIVNYTDVEDVKEIIDIVDRDIILSDELLKLGKKISDDTISSLMSVYQAMMPSSLKIKTQTSNYQLYDEFVVLNKEENQIKEYIENNKRSKVQNNILNSLLNGEEINKKDVSISSFKKLLELDLVKVNKVNKYRINIGKKLENKCALTKDQEKVVNFVD